MTEQTPPASGAEQGVVVPLSECPPGPFLFQGHLGFKTEYKAMETVGPTNIPGSEVRWKVGNGPDAYVMASGEVFWGGAKTKAERDALMVQPIEVVPVLSPRPDIFAENANCSGVVVPMQPTEVMLKAGRDAADSAYAHYEEARSVLAAMLAAAPRQGAEDKLVVWRFRGAGSTPWHYTDRDPSAAKTIRDIQPLYLSADGGWNFDLSSAPEGEAVLLATEGDHVGEAIAPVRDDDNDDWFWAGAGFVHKNTPPLAWRPLPDHPDATPQPVQSAPGREWPEREKDIAWLNRQRETGHCGESTSDAIARGRLDDRIDRILAALSQRAPEGDVIQRLEATGRNWIVAKGSLSDCEPPYGCQILDGETIVAEGECATLNGAVERALSDIALQSPAPAAEGVWRDEINAYDDNATYSSERLSALSASGEDGE